MKSMCVFVGVWELSVIKGIIRCIYVQSFIAIRHVTIINFSHMISIREKAEE